MGSKRAVVHLRTDTPETVLRVLEEKFARKVEQEPEDELMMQFLRAMAEQNIAQIRDEEERREKRRLMEEILSGRGAQKSAAFGSFDREAAEIVVRKEFVSLYWYDHIRVDNMERKTREYAALCGVPALGVSLFDDDMLTFYAISHAGENYEADCYGYYYFLEEDVKPVDPIRLCKLLEIEPLTCMFSRVFRCDDIEEMMDVLADDIGLPVFFEEDMEPVVRWEGAAVFDCRKER